MTRKVARRYDDPVDAIWVAAAARLGIVVERTSDAYAAYDGSGRLALASREHFDADDSLAQMILHELCHALVAGACATERADWGLSNHDDRDLVQEHACQRLQASLAQRHGVGALFAVTTDHRPYWDALPSNPLAAGDDPAIAVAREALARARTSAWFQVIDEALRKTADIADAVRPDADGASLWAKTLPRHATGFVLGTNPSETCGECAWSHAASERARALRCRQAERERAPVQRVRASDAGCVRWEPKLRIEDCRACGACCREGYHVAPVGRHEPVVTSRPDLVSRSGRRLLIERPDGRCVALRGRGSTAAPFDCSIYEIRPRACRDLAPGGAACLEARRRVGLGA